MSADPGMEVVRRQGERPHLALFLATSGHSGVDRSFKRLVPALARRGYRVDLLQVRRHGPYIEPLPPNCRRIDLGTRHVYSAIPALVRYLRHNQPQVLFAGKYRVNLAALLAHRWAKSQSRLVLSSGTTVSVDLAGRGWFERTLHRWVIAHWYRNAHLLVANSRGVADDLAACAGLASQAVQVVPRAVIDADLLQAPCPKPDHPWYRSSTEPVFVSVGELSERKDHATLIRAFAQLNATHPARLIILGKGREQSRLQALAQALKVADRVQLPGFVDQPFGYMAHATALVHSARWEGLGFVLIEALAVGTPVISTDCPSGPREILNDGQLGTLVPVADVSAMASAMRDALNAPPSAERLRQGARVYET